MNLFILTINTFKMSILFRVDNLQFNTKSKLKFKQNKTTIALLINPFLKFPLKQYLRDF